MKTLKDIIQEKLVINKNVKGRYSCHPMTWEDLRTIIEKRLEKDKNADLNDIDVSKITDMSYLFENLDPHNIDISDWNVSNVTDMFEMFRGCKNFNSDLSKWDVSKVKDMYTMFLGCKKFNCDLSKWDVSKVKNMKEMFYECTKLKNIPSWYHE